MRLGALIGLQGWLLVMPILIVYAAILRNMWKLTRSLEDMGYAITAAPVRLPGWAVLWGSLAAMLAAVLLTAFLGQRYPMDWHTRDDAPQDETIRQQLLAKGFLPDCVSAVLERLRETRLIDDREIALRAVEFASAGKTGIYALKRKLRARGIRESDVEDALETISDEDQLAAAAAVAKKLAPRYEGRDPREAHAKLSQALARRGFSWSVIEQTLSMPDMDDTDFT